MVDPIFVPAAYLLVIVGLQIGPSVVRYVSSGHRNRRLYSKLVSRHDSPELFSVLIQFLFTMQHQVDKQSAMMVTYKFGRKTFVFKLPRYNTEWYVQTKYTGLIFRIISMSGTTMDAIEVSVVQRCWKGLWTVREHKLNCLNYFMQQLCLMGNIYAANATRPEIISTDPVCKPVFDKSFQEEVIFLQQEQEQEQSNEAVQPPPDPLPQPQPPSRPRRRRRRPDVPSDMVLLLQSEVKTASNTEVR